ncbi:MAG: carboxypeptidase regulatory-like domain-containing protein [Fidelibacterota bacterium]|nr:MAG: carboxypeptidase regulatory-like domain-containing protein [Candidatus Neomarinimicrobiota bacterium]
MKKIGFLLFVPLLVFTALLAMKTGSGAKTPTAVQELAPLAEQNIDIEAIQAQRLVRSKIGKIKMMQSQESRLRQARPIRQHRLSKGLNLSTFGRDSFSGSYASPRNSVLAKSLAVESTISVLINGVKDATIPQGDDLVIQVTFSAGQIEAYADMWIDMDADKALDDTVDLNLADIEEGGGGGTIIDGDFEDEDPTVGVYQITMPADDGPGGVAGLRVLAVVTDSLGADTAAAFIEPEVTDWSVSGTVTPNVANVLIGAFPWGEMSSDEGPEGQPRMTVTNPDGTYQLYVPEAGFYEIFSFDFLGAQKGLLPDTSYHEVDLTATTAHLTSYDFTFAAPTSFIEGFVYDQDDFPVPGVMVYVEGEGGPGMGAETNDAGFYSIGALPGWHRIGVDKSVLPDYMIPPGEEVFVAEHATEIMNFTLYETNATISGTVTLDDIALPGLEIGAWGDPVGYSRSMTNVDGNYILQVSSRVDEWGYNVWPEDQPDSTYFMDKLWEIPPGASGVNIHFMTAAGGIAGVVTDATSGDTLWDVHIMVLETTTDAEYHTGVDWETGEYLIYIPDGTYEVSADAYEYARYHSGPITVSGSVVTHNIALAPIVFNASISGTITDCEVGFALAGAGVGIYSPSLDYGDWTETDSAGNFYLDVPASDYDVWADMPGYHGQWVQVTAPADGNVDASMCLDKFTFVAPVITSIIDRGRFSAHPDDEPDQGGWVYLTFDGGGTQEGPFIGWNIWRVTGSSFNPTEMVNVGFLLFQGESNYTVLLPTRADSGAAYPFPAQYLSYYLVTGYSGDEGFEWFDSNVGSGYSVDNIAPGVPDGVALRNVESGVQLDWDPSADVDFQYFTVYRAEASGAYGDALYAAVEANTFTDESLAEGIDYHYAVKAVDANGNESDLSAEVSISTIAVADGQSIPDAYALGANYPNPFNPSTTITYQLPEAGHVNLQVYDLTGKVVNTLVGEYQPAGYHQVLWNGKDHKGAPMATGVYFYRIVAGKGYAETRKMVLMK